MPGPGGRTADDGESVALSAAARTLVEKTKGPWDDRRVARAIEEGVRYILSRQNDNGSFGDPDYAHIKEYCWKPYSNSYKWRSPAVRQKLMGTVKLQREEKPGSVGCTAIAVNALLKSGMGINSTEVQKGLEYLTTHDTFGVYSIGLRCNTWVAAEKYLPGKYMKYLRHDALRLIYSIHKDAGGWDYSIWLPNYHNSTSQFGILGIWGYQQLGGAIPAKFWPLAMKYWVKGQLANGGWGYHAPFGGAKLSHTTWSREQHREQCGSMCAAGLASLFICMDAVNDNTYLRCEGGELPSPIVKGLDWFHHEFANTMVGETKACGGSRFCYYLYGVERVGHACGYKYFGKQDWYKLGALTLLEKQRSNGGWGDLTETCFALFFLAKGRYPLLFNKLDFGGDWNNRPRDIANLTRWINRNYEQNLKWQIVKMAVDPAEWHDAPILYLSGSRKPSFSEEDIRKLRTFAYQGGTIFSLTECGGERFDDGIRDVYRKAFPRYALRKAPSSHALYSCLEELDGMPPLYILDNGVRPLVIHSDYDAAKIWQARKYSTRKTVFQFGANLSRYVLGRWNELLPRGKTYWPFPADEPEKSIAVGRIRHAGNCNPEPLALMALKRKLAKEENLGIDPKTVLLEKLDRSGVAVATMTGTGTLSLSAAQQAALKTFARAGGTLLVDAAGGDKTFYTSMHGQLREIFGASAIRPLSVGSPIYTIKALGATTDEPNRPGMFRPLTLKRVSSGAPRLEAIEVSGRTAVILSREDLTAGLLGSCAGTIDGYTPQTAYELVRNIMLKASGYEKKSRPPEPRKKTAGEEKEPKTVTELMQKLASKPGTSVIDLTTVKPASQKVGYGRLHINSDMEPKLSGKKCSRWIFAHADSKLVYDLPEGARYFFSVGASGSRPQEFTFIVKADDEVLYKSKPLKRYPEDFVVMFAKIPPGAKKLTLITDSLGSNTADHSMWCYPVLFTNKNKD